MWLMLIPVAAFVMAFCFGAAVLWYVAKRSKFSQTRTSHGEVMHLESPIGTLDVHPETKLDARLAQIPLYLGAMSSHATSAEIVTEIHLDARSLQDISASYWTPDPADRVFEFYRRELPDWPRNLNRATARELIHQDTDCVRLIRVTTQNGRTLIETSIKPPEYPNIFSDS